MNKNDFTKRGGFNKPVSVTENDGEREAVIIADLPTDDEVQLEVPSKDEAPEVSPDEVTPPEIPATGMRKHRLNFMRLMNQEEHDALKESMLKNYDGENFPIIVTSDGTLDSNGEKLYEEIADGWNSWLMTQELGLKPVFKKVDWTDELILQHVIQAATRRNLSPSDAAFVVVRYKILHTELEAEAKANSLANLKKGNEKPDSAKLHTRKNEGRTADKVIKELNVKTSARSVAKADKAVKEDPDLLRKIDSGEISAKDAIKGKKKALETSADSKDIVIPTETDKNAKLVMTRIKKAKEKVIELQKKMKIISTEVAKVHSKLMGNHDNTENKKYAEEIRRLCRIKDDYKFEIKTILDDLGYLLVFDTKYLKTKMSGYEGEVKF